LFAWLAAGTPAANAFEIVQHFPANRAPEEMKTQWRIIWGIERHAGMAEVLVIKGAYFKRGPDESEIKVLGDCRLAEIFVPYNNGARIYDISAMKFNLVQLDKKALGPTCVTEGAIYDREGQQSERGPVLKEVHDGKVRWMNAREKLLRGQNMSLWSVINGANYRYVVLYEFRDDGVVGFKVGATAHNLFKFKTDKSTHQHVGHWRLNVVLGNAAQTRVSVVEHDSVKLKTMVTPLTKEARVEWDPERFTRLRVESLVEKNTHVPPSFIGYELAPLRAGSPRYYGKGEEFTLHDFWVTRARGAEMRARELPQYENGENIQNMPVTIWHMAGALHEPRDEDFGDRDLKPRLEANPGLGVALTAWAGFELRPRNFFRSTPLYQP